MIRMIEWIVSSSALMAVLIVLRHILKGKISLRLQYALWGLALLRLLVPVSFGSTAVSVQNALPKQQMRELPFTAENTYFVYRSQETIKTENESRTYELPRQWRDFSTERAELEQSGENWSNTAHAEVIRFTDLALILWIAGMIAVALCLFGSNLRFALRLRKNRKLLREETLPVYLTEEVDTPCLFGLFRPAVYVTPEAAEEEGRLRHVIEHELTHYRHGDHLWSLLRGICLILHWYNPLVWWGAILSRRDCELACDEATIRRLGEGERTAYGRTLIYMTCQKRPALLMTATTMTGSKGSIKERIRLIARKPRTVIAALVALLLIAAVAVGCTFTGGKEPEPSAAEAPAAPTPEVTPTSAVLPPDSADAELTAAAKALMEDYCQRTGRLCTEDAAVLRYSDGVSADVVYPCLGKRYSVCVPFRKGEDGSWAPLGAESVYLIENRDRDFVELKLELGEQKVPEPVAQYAQETVQRELEYYEREVGYVFDEAKVTGITSIATGAVGTTSGCGLYLLEYRLLPASDQEIMMVGGMTMEDGYLTEWGSVGQPYLLVYWKNSNGVDSWTPLCVTNTDEIMTQYGTPEMLEKYGDAFTAAAVELKAKNMVAQGLLDPRYLSVSTPASDPGQIGMDWAAAYAEKLLHAPEDDPWRCETVEVRKCDLIAESLLSEPKTYVYSLEIACDPVDDTELNKAMDDAFVEWGQDTVHPGWADFLSFIVLESQWDGSWKCVKSSMVGSWGYLNYSWDVSELLNRLVTEQMSGEDALMLLPLIDWGEFDQLPSDIWDASFNALWAKCEEACLTEGRYWDPERTVLYSDIYFYDQIIRDMYVILGFLHADGAYAEGLAYLMAKQYDYDPGRFENCLTLYLNLTEEQERNIRLSIENEMPGIDAPQPGGSEKKINALVLNRVEIILTGRGETYTFQPVFTPKDSDEPIRWTSSDPTVATVDASGTVTAVADGKAVIRAETERVFAECIVRVEFLGSEDSESVIAALHIYDGPTREKMEPKGVRRVILDGSNSDEAETVNEIKSIIDGIRFWTDDEMADRLEFYFDGDIVFSDREFVYYFSFDKRTVFYDRYFSTISEKDMEYIRSIAGE